jgi:hypothetical protein
MAVITISRQYGSGGNEIATRVSEMLGYTYFDKGLITQQASRGSRQMRLWKRMSQELRSDLPSSGPPMSKVIPCLSPRWTGYPKAA